MSGSARRAGPLLVALVLVLAVSGCGPYRVRYVMPSCPPSGEIVYKKAVHGIGGGSSMFWIVQQMLPALVRYTEAVDVTEAAPRGFAEVQHYHSFGQQWVGGLVGLIIDISFYHPSYIEIHKSGHAR